MGETRVKIGIATEKSKNKNRGKTMEWPEDWPHRDAVADKAVLWVAVNEGYAYIRKPDGKRIHVADFAREIGLNVEVKNS